MYEDFCKTVPDAQKDEAAFAAAVAATTLATVTMFEFDVISSRSATGLGRRTKFQKLVRDFELRKVAGEDPNAPHRAVYEFAKSVSK
jgi:hypothetical protein